MSISGQSISEQIHHLIDHIEVNHHEHLKEDLLLEMKKNGMSDFPSLSMLEYHVIAYIGDKNITNAVSVAKHLNITRGGISKINQRLIGKELIESHQLEGNKRELFYKLTPAGKKVYFIHRSLHEKAETSLLRMISNYSESEKETIRKFICDLIEKVL